MKKTELFLIFSIGLLNATIFESFFVLGMTYTAGASVLVCLLSGLVMGRLLYKVKSSHLIVIFPAVMIFLRGLFVSIFYLCYEQVWADLIIAMVLTFGSCLFYFVFRKRQWNTDM